MQDGIVCSRRHILLSTTRGIGFGKEGITSKVRELETDSQFSKNQVSHDRFGFG
jgi:hypothetical protein